MRITPDADPHDGLLDVCIADELSSWEALALLPRIFSGRHIRHPAVRIERTRYLEICCQEPRVVYADGEFVGQTPLTLHCEAAALQVLLPAA
jgi:diacylglycerol kinase (ATP)